MLKVGFVYFHQVIKKLMRKPLNILSIRGRVRSCIFKYLERNELSVCDYAFF